jgi:hypothetical protein
VDTLKVEKILLPKKKHDILFSIRSAEVDTLKVKKKYFYKKKT